MLLLGVILALIVLAVAITATRLLLIALGFICFWDRSPKYRRNEKALNKCAYHHLDGTLLAKIVERQEKKNSIYIR